MFKGILLDIDNTLYQYDPLHAIAQKALLAKISEDHKLADDQVMEAYKQAKLLVKNNLPAVAASHNRLLYVQTTCELLNIDALSNSLDLYNCYWDTFLNALRLTAGAKQFFSRYGHLPICLVTDLTAHIQHRKIAQLELMHWANFVVTSEEAGCEKPHPYMFELALRKLGLNANEVCMIGDSYKKDIQGAKNLGIHAFWLTDEAPQVNEKGITQVNCLGDIQW